MNRGKGPFLAVLILLALPCLIRAQRPEGSIKFKAAARVQALTDGDTSPKLHWVLLSIPDPGDVSFSNPDAQALVVQAIKEIAAQPGDCKQWALETRTKCSFPSALTAKLKDLSLAQVNMRNPPAAPGQTPEPAIRFQFTPRSQAHPTIESLTVRITTEFFDRTTRDANPGSPLTLTWQAASTRVRPATPSPVAAPPVPITVQFTAADRRKSTGGAFDAQVIQDALLEVGIAALEKARDGNCLPGAPTPANTAMERVQNAIADMYAVPIPGWPKPVVSFRFEPGTGDYTLAVRGVLIASGARVEIVRGQIQGASGMVDFTGASPAIEKGIQETLASAATDAARSIKPQLDNLIAHVPTVGSVDAARNGLRSGPMISGNVDVRKSLSGIVFFGTRRWSLGSLNVKSKLAGSLTPEDFLTGQASLDASNLLRNVLPVSVEETYNLNIQAGPEVQRSTFDFAIPRTRGKTWIMNYGFRQSFFYSRDWNQRFGNSLPADPKLINRQEGITPALFVEFSRQPDDKFPWIFSTRLEASYDWRSVHIEPRLAGAPDVLNGQLSAPTFEFRQLAGRDSATGFIGATRVQVDAVARRGTHALAGDYAFEQFTASARAEAFFGAKRNSDYFLRYERGLGYSGNGTPLF
ncbi:MAG: hypothetical protein ABJC09_06470, partial [Terriglobia bacterium]